MDLFTVLTKHSEAKWTVKLQSTCLLGDVNMTPNDSNSYVVGANSQQTV